MINTNDLESITLQSGEKVTGRFLPDGTFDPVVFMIIPNLTNLQATTSADFLNSELDEYKKLNNKLPDLVYYSNAVEIILYAIYEDIKNLVPTQDYSMAVVPGYNYDLPSRSTPIKKFLKTDFKEFFTKHTIMIACYKSALKNILSVGLSMTNEEIKEIIKNSFYLGGELKGNKVHINKLGFDYNISAFDQMDFFKNNNLDKKIYDPDKFFGPAAVMQDDSIKLFEFITRLAL